jgi:hypothetical protein
LANTCQFLDRAIAYVIVAFSICMYIEFAIAASRIAENTAMMRGRRCSGRPAGDDRCLVDDASPAPPPVCVRK